MKKKRFFVSLVCFALVLSMVSAIPASAAAAHINLSQYNAGVSTSGATSYTEYSYSGTGYGYVSNKSSVLSGNYMETTGSGTIKFCHGYSNNRICNSNLSDSKSIYHDITGCNNVSDFTSVTVHLSFTLYSSVATSGYYCTWLVFLDDEYNVLTYNNSGEINFSIGAEEYVDFHVVRSPSVPSNAAYFCPIVLAIFRNVPSGTYLYFSEAVPGDGSLQDGLSQGFRYVVRTDRTADTPIFTSNLSTDPVYCQTGSAASQISVNASVSDGGTITYQWYSNTKPSTNGAVAIAGETGRSFIPPSASQGEFYYYCVATNNYYGITRSRVSNFAHIVVYTPPVSPQITSNLPPGLLEYVLNSPSNALSFNAIITDDGELTYQWYSNSINSNSGGSPIAGANSTQFTPPTDVVGLVYYYCVATNTKYEFTSSVTSSVAGVRVVPPPEPAVAPVITSDLSAEEVVYEKGDSAAALRIGAESPDGGALSYQWYEVSSSSFIEIPGEIYASFTPDTSAVCTKQYACIVTNTLNESSASVTSQIATVTVQKDQTDTLLGGIIDAITGMWDSLTELPSLITDGLSDFFGDLSAKLSNVFEAIAGLPQAILDGIKGLFVPDAEAMAAYQDQWSELLKDRFGAIYESVDVIGEFVSSLNAGSTQKQIMLPAVTVNLAGVPWTFGGWSVDVVPDGFSFLATSSKLIVNIIATFAFINGLRNKFEGILGGRGS